MPEAIRSCRVGCQNAPWSMVVWLAVRFIHSTKATARVGSLLDLNALLARVGDRSPLEAGGCGERTDLPRA